MLIKRLRDQCDRLFPFICQVCGKHAEREWELCEVCEIQLPWLVSGCEVCSRPLPHSTKASVCGRCLNHPPLYDRLLAVFAYKGEVQQSIVNLKYHRSTPATRLLGQLLKQAALNDFASGGLLVPVPLHSSRQRQRGYNQSIELAKEMASDGDWILMPTAIKKCRATLPQTGLSAAARSRNLTGAFRASGQVKGKKVLLLDDVVTTDSTISECVKALKKAGAGKINVIAVARAVG